MFQMERRSRNTLIIKYMWLHVFLMFACDCVCVCVCMCMCVLVHVCDIESRVCEDGGGGGRVVGTEFHFCVIWWYNPTLPCNKTLQESCLVQIGQHKLINARYCERFPVVRWKDGRVVHVQVTPEVHRNYEQRMQVALNSFQQRYGWKLCWEFT